MNKYKLVAVDLDGTLLDEQYTVTPEVKDIVARARGRGIDFTFATGRLFPSARVFAAELGITLPLITYNGALIKEAAGTGPLFHLPLDRELALKVLDLTRVWPGRRFVFINDVVYTDIEDEVTRSYAIALRVEFRRLDQLTEALFEGPTMITFRDNPPEIDKLTGFMKQQFHDEIYMVNSRPFFLDVTHRNVSKGRGLSELCTCLGIQAEEVIAIGDGWNDAEMLDFAGLGAVVANAPEELKARADYVAAGNHYHGVIEVMEKFLGI